MSAVSITPEQAAAVRITWNAIGPDTLAECPDIDNAVAVEQCLDADRVEMYAKDGKRINNEFKVLFKKHGYNAVLSAVATVCKLA